MTYLHDNIIVQILQMLGTIPFYCYSSKQTTKFCIHLCSFKYFDQFAIK